MPPEVDAAKWSGEGAFTQLLIERLRALPAIAAVRVEDAPTSRSEADYNFISNEVFVAFAVNRRRERVRRFGVIPASRWIVDKAMAMPQLEQALSGIDGIGAPDYSDEGMLQYLRTERIVPPYQTRGYKLVELVRIYEAGVEIRR
ncbi:MAG TPA: hypothetical protein VFB07_08225 [Vicinamibacterales bacterium]|nr:hypothetical protein [Vicinamibacterales bacterium]